MVCRERYLFLFLWGCDFHLWLKYACILSSDYAIGGVAYQTLSYAISISFQNMLESIAKFLKKKCYGLETSLSSTWYMLQYNPKQARYCGHLSISCPTYPKDSSSPDVTDFLKLSRICSWERLSWPLIPPFPVKGFKNIQHYVLEQMHKLLVKCGGTSFVEGQSAFCRFKLF